MKIPASIVFASATCLAFSSALAGEISLSSWKAEGASAFFRIEGTGERSNPVRRGLGEAYSGDELFVRFSFRYEAETIDEARPEAENPGDGEFFVLWLDRTEGGEASSHSGGVPNIGIHVDGEGKNRFMVRYVSGRESFGPELEGDREFTVVARLAKSTSGPEAAFDELSLWIDPAMEGDTSDPVAVVRDESAISSVSWVGFSTGQKTEVGDRVFVGDLRLASDWGELFDARAVEELTEIPLPPEYVPPPFPVDLVEVAPAVESIETDHWSFQPMTRPTVPQVAFSDWVRNPVDAFIAAKHEEVGLVPAPPAGRVALNRRISLVLSGLPPENPNADPEELVEELLGSVAFGERWGRHWLDVARWAESHGHQHNRHRDHAWRYRDWVVESFVENKPFDEFLREQIAGDEIEPFDPDHVVATGFLAAARYSGNELDKAIQRNDILVDIVNTTSKAFLGLTMECAQCHDHFFDPVTQWDYYNLMAYFAKGQPGDVILAEGDARVRELVSQRWGIFESVRDRMIENKRAAGVPEPVLVIPKSVPGGMTAAEKRSFARIESELAKFPKTWAFHSPVTSSHDLEFAPTAQRWPLPFQKESLEFVEVRFLDRGEVTTPGPVAEPGWPVVFGKSRNGENRGRLELADWLTDPEHPLTARVWVNRIWQGYFGSGLVPTSGDFGVAGTRPSHPELLDWLAHELVDSGWDSKRIHELILGSNTFRMSADFSASNADRDPDNSLLGRWKPRRLESEAIRDSLLAVSGELDRNSGGPSVPIEESDDSLRRSLYLFQRRDELPHQQRLFDSADAIVSCAKRRVSTVGLQPLWLMNSDFVQRRAAAVAERIESMASPEDGPDSSARRLVSLVLGREAEREEAAELRKLIESTSLSEAAVVVLNTNEFLYIP